MCMRATCNECKKATWVGCGGHIGSVLDAVPVDKRCSCEPKVVLNGKEYPPRAK